MTKYHSALTFTFVCLGLLGALYVNAFLSPTWVESRLQYQIERNVDGDAFYVERGNPVFIGSAVPYQQSVINQDNLDRLTGTPPLTAQWVFLDNDPNMLVQLKADYHYGLWSLLPALTAIALCLITREPLIALLGGIVSGAFMLGKFDITSDVLIPNLATTSAATILILYLWLLGGLMGVWAKTGAAQAFASYMSDNFVKGPRSAKVVTWLLGVLFFQGGTMSTVLVGTTVKPLADKAGVSHEELSYVVDSTASPIASVLAFNAWPAYVQAFLFLPGVAFLATESDRIAFFFDSIPFSFYGLFAVVGTLLVSLNIMHFAGAPLRRAAKRARESGQLDAPNATPLSAKELSTPAIPEGYQSSVLEFILPLVTLVSVAVITFVYSGTPQIIWAFAMALGLAIAIALLKGMSLSDVLEGFGLGLKGVVVASVILMLAITIGAISKQLGGGIYLVESLGNELPFWILPVTLQVITMVIAFSTGTSWGTYAIAFPLAMPLAWSIAQTSGIDSPHTYLMICFAAVLNGSVFGDQCSPISDTTILSSMTTGCDLMDHVKSQLVPASLAAITAAFCWTLATLLFA